MYAFRENCFFISNSGLQKITVCPTKARNSIIHRRRLRGDIAPLRFGKHIHSVLAWGNRMRALERKWDEERIEGVQLSTLDKLFQNSPCETEEWRNLGMAQAVIKAYNLQFSQEEHEIVKGGKWNRPLVESTFAVDTGVTFYGWRIIYTGTIDLVWKLGGEGVYIFDYKTTTMLGESFWMEKEQAEAQRGYCWSYLKATGVEPMGYIIRALAMRKPTKTGTSIEFQTQKFYTKVPEGQLDEWYNNMLAQCETFLWHVSRSKFPRYHEACMTRYNKPCDFFNVCRLPAKDREAELWSDLYEEDDGMSLK